jgi:hypothetical protein
MAKEGINLATMWLPLAPSIEGDEFKNAGKRAFQQFSGGFDAENAGSAEGKRFADKWVGAFKGSFANADFGGFTKAFEKINQQVDAVASKKLGAHLPALRQEYEKTTAEMYKLREALHQIQVADDQATATGRGTIQMLVQRRKLESEYAESGKKAVAAQKEYNSTLSEYEAVSQKANTSSTLLGAAMGGGLVLAAQGVIAGFEGIAHLGEHLFEDAVHGAEALTDRLLEVGSTFANLEVQIHEFSGLTGEAFETANAHVKDIFGTLDVSGKNLGQTYAKLATVLHAEPGTPMLDELARNVTELQGRFANFKSQDVTEIFTAFHTPLEETNDDLAFILQASQDAGLGLGDFAALMAGPVSEAAAGMGLNIRQAALFTEALGKSGIPARQSLMALGNAQSFYNSINVSFKDGLAETRREMDALANDPNQQDALSEKVFGKGVKSDIGKQLLNDLSDAANATGPALDVPVGKMHEFLDATATLETKLQGFRNKIFEAFAPFGTAAEHAVSGGLNLVSAWFDTHHDQIIGKIREWGTSFIETLPKIRDFAVMSAHILEVFGVAAMAALGPFIEGMIAVSASVLFATLHFKEAGQMLKLGMDIPMMEGRGLRIFNEGLGALEKMDFHTQSMVEGFQRIADSSESMKFPEGFGMPGSGAPGAPGGPAAPGGSAVQGPPLSSRDSPAGPQTAGSGGGGDSGGTPPAAQGSSFHANWDAIARAESSGNWQIDHGQGPDVTGGLQIATATWISHGGLQYAPKAYLAPPVDQVNVAEKILADPNQGPKAWPATFAAHPEYFEPQQFAQGGSAPASSGNGLSKLLAKFGFGPKGKDTVLSYYTPGEFVVTEDTMEKHGPLIRALQGKGRYFAGGGDGAANYAASGAGDDDMGIVPQLKYSEQVAHGFGLKLTAGRSGHGTHDVDGGYHDTGEAADFSNGVNTDQELAFAMYMYEHFGSQLAELIYSDPRMPKLIKDGKSVEPSFYGAETLAGHRDHVHVAIHAAQTVTDQMTPGSEPVTGPGPVTAGRGGSVSLPGGSVTPMSYGSGSAGGGGDMHGGYAPGTPEAHDAYERNRAVQRGNDHIETLTTERQQDAAKLSQAQTDLNAEQLKADQLQDHKKIDELLKTIPELQARIKKIDDEELPDAKEELSEATTRAGEPIKSKSGKSSSMDSEAKSLGGSFLSGLAQEFGFGSLFGKSPAEWGITKLFGGLAKWGLGELNALGDAGGRIGGDAKPQGMGQNFLAGLAGSAGIPGFNLAAQAPAPQFPGGPNTAYDGGTPGAAPGPAPAPAASVPNGPAHYHDWYAPGQPKPAPVAPPEQPKPAPPLPPGASRFDPNPLPIGPVPTPAPTGDLPLLMPSGFTKQTPAGAPGSIVPKPPGQQPISYSKGLPKADVTSSSDQNFGKRWAPGFDGQPTPQPFPGGALAGQLISAAFAVGGAALSAAKPGGGAGGKPGGGNQFGGGGGAIQVAGGGDQGQPLGATGITMGYGSVPTSYQGDTHNYHVDNSTTWNVSPKNDASTVQHLREHQNAQRSNAALASGPGMLPMP